MGVLAEQENQPSSPLTKLYTYLLMSYELWLVLPCICLCNSMQRQIAITLFRVSAYLSPGLDIKWLKKANDQHFKVSSH